MRRDGVDAMRYNHTVGLKLMKWLLLILVAVETALLLLSRFLPAREVEVHVHKTHVTYHGPDKPSRVEPYPEEIRRDRMKPRVWPLLALNTVLIVVVALLMCWKV
jgi:uncharacterized protein YpmS